MYLRKSDSGMITAEALIIMPLAFIMILVLIQLAIYEHASQVVQRAAGVGERYASAYNGSVQEAYTQVDTFLRDVDAHELNNIKVEIARSQYGATVRVTASVTSILSFLNFNVSGYSLGDLQYFRPNE
jgi:Flp pilus assembly protein TadG